MATITDKTQPSFVHWPLQNNRTALQPVNIPLVLVVPFVRDPITNVPVTNSEVSNLKFFIEEAPGKVPVAGFQNAGIFVPDYARFVRDVTTLELSNVIIDLSGLPFFDKDTGELKSFADAVAGDTFEYTLIRGLVESIGPRDRIEFIPGANYYDLSPFVIETIELKPYGAYRFSWQCDYYHRVMTPEGELFCIDTVNRRIARFTMLMKHPGEIHQMMIEQTPTVYFDGTPLDQDNLVKFYRPFADALQDIFDEQSLLVGINFIEKIPAQFIPYLAYLIGWDLPYFPGSTDRIRRAVLRNGRKLQQLKGSERAIRELFEIFGYTIDIINLWYKKNGVGFVGPGEEHTDSEDIEIQEICQTEVLMAEYQTNGFGNVEIPLLFRPDGDITIDGWYVDSDSAADVQLQSLIDTINIDPEGLMSSVCPATTDGFLISQPLEDQVTETPLGQSKVLLTQRLNAIDHIQTGDAPLSQYGAKYDFDKNLVTLTFDHYLRFDNTKKLYVFATYKRKKIVVPPSLKDLRSNRFDIQILLDRTTGEAPNSHLLDFLLDFIFKLKAFHSILRKIIFNLNVTDVYNVTDFCMGGRITQSPGTDAGELQTLPPVIPADIDGCNDDVFRRGFKDADFDLRDEIINGLKAEHSAWKALDGTRDISSDLIPIIESLQRVPMNTSTEAIYGEPGIDYGSNIVYGDDQTCEFTQHGQERVIAKFDTDGIDKDFDNETDDREKLCDDTNNVLDNCFKGRVSQDLVVNRVIPLMEIVRNRPCELMMGEGFYYYNPVKPKTLGEVTYNSYSYGNFEYNTSEIDTSKLENLGRSYLTDLIIRATANTEYIHYTKTVSLTDNDVHTNDKAAIRRPSLDIDKDNMFFPGHRFVAMNRLEEDFTSSVYYFRPWDYLFHLCPEDVPEDHTLYGELGYGIPLYNDESITIDDLNPHIIIGTNGDEYLVFNNIPYKLYGNGLVPDISSMGSHDASLEFITHDIFSSLPSDYVDHTEGSLVDATTYASVPLESVCFSDGYDPIFNSANRNCPCDSTSSFVAGSTDLEGMDYIDGYPAVFGRYLFNPDDTDYPRGASDDVDLELLLGLPSEATSIPSDLLFKLGSGIRIDEPNPGARHYKPHRLDCGCLFFDCGSAESSVPHVERCNIELYRDEDGSLDLESDKITIGRNMVLAEEYGTCTIQMGLSLQSQLLGELTIGDMFQLDPSKITIVQNGALPPSGEFFFTDAYGIVYEGIFETNDTRIDITYKTKDPRVWTEEPQGFIQNNRVFRRGVITSCRTISEAPVSIPNDISATILAHGCAQGIETFQTTFSCGDKLPKDPFAFHLECGIVDELEIETGTEITSL